MTQPGGSVFVLEVGFPPEGPRIEGVYASRDAAMAATQYPDNLWEQGDDNWWQAGRGPQLRVITEFEVRDVA